MRQDLQYTILQGRALLAELGEKFAEKFLGRVLRGDKAQVATLTRMCCGVGGSHACQMLGS